MSLLPAHGRKMCKVARFEVEKSIKYYYDLSYFQCTATSGARSPDLKLRSQQATVMISLGLLSILISLRTALILKVSLFPIFPLAILIIDYIKLSILCN